MAGAKVLQTAEPSLAAKPMNYAPGVVTCLFIVAIAALSLYSLKPPSPIAASAPATEFSSARAIKHVLSIAQKPHPLGSPAKAAVRDYLFGELKALRLNPEVQKATAINQDLGSAVLSGNVENVLAKMKGMGDGPALLLMAHYDSTPSGPGASDDAAAVAAILETARALGEGPPLTNDVILLLTDGEEMGLLGAKAFVQQHPWAKRIGLVINFEARGHSGPAIMFETSNNNSRLIREFAGAAPYPIANSLAYEVYKNLGRDTDLSVFKNAGYPAMNFAYIDGLNRNHTMTDSIDNLDERSLQHSGSYCLSLARHFGNLNLAETRQGNEVYFDILGRRLAHYPGSVVMPLAVAALLLFVGVLIVGLKRRRMTLSGVALGAGVVFLGFLSSALVAQGLWWALRLSNSGYRLFSMDDVYGGKWHMAGFLALTFAVTSAINLLFRKRIRIPNLAMGGMIWWLVLTILTSIYVPGASYLFTWPLLFALAAMWLNLKDETLSVKRVAAQCIFSIPLLILFPPLIWLVYTAVGLANSGLVMVMSALGWALLIPQLDVLMARKQWLPPAASAALAAILIGVGVASFGFDEKNPKPTSVFYAVNPDLKRAIWASVGQTPDEWTAQFFSPESKIAPVGEFFPTQNWFLRSDAPVLTAPPPSVTLIDDQVKDEVRALRLRIVSPRQAPNLSLYVDCAGELVSGVIDGQATYRRLNNQLAINYYGLPDEGVEVILRAKTSAPIKITAVDFSYGLPQAPEIQYRPRPENLMPTAFRYDDTTLVSKSYSF
jgi:hypothetical protein